MSSYIQADFKCPFCGKLCVGKIIEIDWGDDDRFKVGDLIPELEGKGKRLIVVGGTECDNSFDPDEHREELKRAGLSVRGFELSTVEDQLKWGCPPQFAIFIEVERGRIRGVLFGNDFVSKFSEMENANRDAMRRIYEIFSLPSPSKAEEEEKSRLSESIELREYSESQRVLEWLERSSSSEEEA